MVHPPFLFYEKSYTGNWLWSKNYIVETLLKLTFLSECGSNYKKKNWFFAKVVIYFISLRERDEAVVEVEKYAEESIPDSIIIK